MTNKKKLEEMIKKVLKENNDIKPRSKWVKIGNSPKTIYIVNNYPENNTVSFYTDRTGKQYKFSVDNFLKNFKEIK